MTKIDFYIASDNVDRNTSSGHKPYDHRLIACRIIEKAYRRNLSVYVHTDTKDDATHLDQLLWSFRPNSFVPHRLDIGEDTTTSSEESIQQHAPDILISDQNDPKAHSDVLINLSNDKPSFYGRFLRLAEIVSADENAKKRSRDRYKFYRERGYPLDVHQL